MWNVKSEHMKPIVAIGDVHGLYSWKPIVEKHPDCRIVFLGDYLDPYEYIPHKELLANLLAIINLKRARPDDVVLLLGNHDMHYFCSDAPISSRFNYQIGELVSRLFLENLGLFRYAWQVGRTIFTHAGISQQWFVDDFKGNPEKPIADQLNHPADGQVPSLCRVGALRGGRLGETGGIFWADIEELHDPLHGFMQVVGHNRVPEVTVHQGEHGNKIVFCDCLRNGCYLYISPGEEGKKVKGKSPRPTALWLSA